jgi:hypothetical protein
MSDLDALMDRLQVAATRTVEDFGDVKVRGHLTEHPAFVAARLDDLDLLVTTVREAVNEERAVGKWPGPVPGDPAAEHLEQAAEYGDHDCDCPFCLHGTYA